MGDQSLLSVETGESVPLRPFMMFRVGGRDLKKAKECGRRKKPFVVIQSSRLCVELLSGRYGPYSEGVAFTQ